MENNGLRVDNSSIDMEISKFLIFVIGLKKFGIDINSIREIIISQKITHIPTTPNYCLGVINLRGEIIPVIDIRKKFNSDISSTKHNNCIIIQNNNVDIGIVVDEVLEFIEINDDEIVKIDNSNSNIDFITGVFRYNEESYQIINCDILIGK